MISGLVLLWALGAGRVPSAVASVRVPGAPARAPALRTAILRALLDFDLGARIDLDDASEYAVDLAMSTCGADAPCLIKQLESSGVLFGCWLREVPGTQALALAIVHPVAGMSAAMVETTGLSEEAIGAELARQLGLLLTRAGVGRVARVELSVDPPEAAFEPPDLLRPDPFEPSVFHVAAGRYAVTVTAPGYEPSHQVIEPAVGAPLRIEVSLRPVTAWYENKWLWIGLGVAAVGATTAAILATSRGHCACLETGPGLCRQCL